jgi:RNA polymerase sigma-70 factor, ECF subfamily
MTDPNASDERELLKRSKAGDEEAFIRLYRERYRGIYRFALHMSGSPSLAEDVTQEVFLRLMRQTGHFDAARGSLRAYLYGIARNLVADHLHRTRLESALGTGKEQSGGSAGSGASGDPLTHMTRREATECLRQAILALPRHYREVIALCELDEMDYVRAAESLGCAVGTVRSRLHRARQLLSKRLSRQYQESAGESLNNLKAPRYAL